ncbi:MAG: 30S ribosomal protein S17e [Candidatus Aenigmarchaeota archaeon]|nr:30S ribosomal protein S17e [Candidatus Aenigmarchaeota archaeon]
MGNIRTSDIKGISKDLLGKFPDKFSPDFEQNKKVLAEMKLFESKIVRNQVAGYIARLAKRRSASAS